MLKVSDSLHPGIRLRGFRGKPQGDRPDPVSAPEEREKEDRQFLCFSCKHPITSESMQIEIQGSHTHRFTNPSGDSFHLRCFRKAPGCETKGVPISDFTWFPGFKWCFSFCSHCGVQMGWFYLSPEESYFGLIREALE